MKLFDDVASAMFEVVLSHGTSKPGAQKLQKVFGKLE